MKHIRSVKLQTLLNKDNQKSYLHYKTHLPTKSKTKKLVDPQIISSGVGKLRPACM